MSKSIKYDHPKGLYLLFAVEMWERFSYYGMRALLVLYMLKFLEFSTQQAGSIYGTYTGLVYLTPLIGGYVADRYLGTKKCIYLGSTLMMLGHFAMALPGLHFFYIALFLLIIGNGFFKPNISTQVGKLYEKNDPRRDSGFTIFYMGINLGAFLSPLICGTLGEKVGFHWGFASAGVGMLIGLLVYIWGEKRYLQPEEQEQPYTPAMKNTSAIVNNNSSSIGLLEKQEQQTQVETKDQRLSIEEKHRIAVIFVLMFFSIFFWASFEQAGTSLTIFADRSVERIIPFLNWEFPVSYFQSVNPLLILLLAPVFSGIWVKLSRSQYNPNVFQKFAIGLGLIAFGFLVMALAAFFALDSKVSFLWLLGVYFFHTVGELCISPVGLSTVTKLAPIKFASLLMGTWFLSSFFANFIGGFFAGKYDVISNVQFFMIPVVITAVSALLLAFLAKYLARFTHGVE